MSDGKKPLKIQFAANPNVQIYQIVDVEPAPAPPDGQDWGDVTFTAHYTQSWPWWICGPIMFWTWLTGGHRNN